MDINKTKTNDLIKQIDGVWFTWTDPRSGETAEFKVARMNNKEFVKLHNQFLGENRGKPLTDYMNAVLVAQTLLKDWRGLTTKDKDGKSVEYPYTYENAVNMLKDPERNDWAVDIVNFANQAERFYLDDKEADNKNYTTNSPKHTIMPR